MTIHALDSLLNIRHREFFQSTARELIFYGGGGAGKSYSAADKIILQMLLERKPLKMLVVRKSMPSIKSSCVEIFQKRLTLMQIPYDFNRNDMMMTFPDLGGARIIFKSINNESEIEKIKSITDVDFIWIEEANEILESAYDQLKLRLRGGQASYEQIILTFNPISSVNWIHKKFFESPSIAHKVHVTVEDNPWATGAYKEQLKALQTTNENLYRVYYLGQWGMLRGAIYTNWCRVDDPPARVEEIIYGLDFGFNHPTALVKIYLSDGIPYLEQKLYASGLTQSDLEAKMKGMGIGNSVIYADCAEPARIEALRRAGFNVKEANKDVMGGISYCQSLTFYVLSSSVDLVKELESYCWQTANGQYIDKPVKFRDDLVDAMRYGIFSHKHSFSFVAIGANGRIDSPSGSIIQTMLMQRMFRR